MNLDSIVMIMVKKDDDDGDESDVQLMLAICRRRTLTILCSRSSQEPPNPIQQSLLLNRCRNLKITKAICFLEKLGSEPEKNPLEIRFQTCKNWTKTSWDLLFCPLRIVSDNHEDRPS